MARKALWTQSQPRPVKPRRYIRRRTVKRAAEERRYRARVKEWLMLPENRWCAVTAALRRAALHAWFTTRDADKAGKWHTGLQPANQCHHSHGRVGRLLLYEPWWVAVSDWGHQWIQDHPEQARKLKLLCPLGQWNSPPPC